MEWPPPVGRSASVLRIGGVQGGLVPVIATDFVVLGDVEFAFIEGDAVWLVQSGEDFDHSAGLAGVFWIGQRDDFAFARFAHEQHSAGSEGEHARAVYIGGEDRDVEAFGQFEFFEIERSFFGVNERG